MKIIHKPRGTGKTTELVKESARTKAVIACYNPSQVLSILDLAKRLKFDIPRPVTFEELFNSTHGRKLRGVKVMIDDLDFMLESIVGYKIHAVSITKKEHGNE